MDLYILQTKKQCNYTYKQINNENYLFILYIFFMNYDKIKPELEKRGIVIKDFCRRINITEQGLHQMIRNRSMKVEVLERVSEVLAVPISYWFDDLEKDGKVFSSMHDPHVDDYSVPFFVKGKIQKRIDSVTGELNKVLKDLARTMQMIQKTSDSSDKNENEESEEGAEA